MVTFCSSCDSTFLIPNTVVFVSCRSSRFDGHAHNQSCVGLGSWLTFSPVISVSPPYLPSVSFFGDVDPDFRFGYLFCRDDIRIKSPAYRRLPPSVDLPHPHTTSRDTVRFSLSCSEAPRDPVRFIFDFSMRDHCLCFRGSLYPRRTFLFSHPPGDPSWVLNKCHAARLAPTHARVLGDLRRSVSRALHVLSAIDAFAPFLYQFSRALTRLSRTQQVMAFPVWKF